MSPALYSRWNKRTYTGYSFPPLYLRWLWTNKKQGNTYTTYKYNILFLYNPSATTDCAHPVIGNRQKSNKQTTSSTYTKPLTQSSLNSMVSLPEPPKQCVKIKLILLSVAKCNITHTKCIRYHYNNNYLYFVVVKTCFVLGWRRLLQRVE